MHTTACNSTAPRIPATSAIRATLRPGRRIQATYIREHLPLERIDRVDGRHSIQDDAPHDVAAYIAGFARMVEDG